MSNADSKLSDGKGKARAWWLIMLPATLAIMFMIFWATTSLQEAASAAQSLGLAIAAVSIPLVVERVRTGIQNTISQRDTNARMTELAISVLSSVPEQSEENISLRRWASSLLETSSGIAIEKSARSVLERTPLPGKPDRRFYSEVATNWSGGRYELLVHSETEYAPTIDLLLRFLRNHRTDSIEAIERRRFDDESGVVWSIRGHTMVTSTSGGSDCVRNRALFDWLYKERPRSLIRATYSSMSNGVQRDVWHVTIEDDNGSTHDVDVPYKWYYGDPRPVLSEAWPEVPDSR